MTLTKEHLRAVMTGTRENRVEKLRQVLGYLSIQKDTEGSQFWYLRPGTNRAQAEETQPIAVGFYSELNSYNNSEIKAFLISQERQQEIYGHYTQRTGENQPVMYILLPTEEETGRVALVLPTKESCAKGKFRLLNGTLYSY